MANGRRPVTTARKLIAAVLGTFAAFIILFGAGMTSWSIAALGVALLVLAISLVVITAFPGTERAWVAGTAHVHSVSEPPASSTYGRCELQILIDAPGVPPRSVKIRDPRVPVSKWPSPRSTLPIMVAIDDQRHVRIMWDDVPTHAEAAAEHADLPPEFDEPDFGPTDDDLLADDDRLLGVDDDPPWARRGPDDDLLADPDTVRTGDPDADLGDLHGPPPADRPGPGRRRDPAENPQPDFTRPGFDPDTDFDPDIESPGPRDDDPLVVRQAPGGQIVLEGTLVDPTPVPLPRRPRPKPYSSAEQGGGAAAGGPTDRDGVGDARMPTAAGTVLADPPEAPDPPTAPPGATEADPMVDLDLDAAGPAAGDDGGGPVHNVGLTLLVADLDRSVAFYRDMLGFYEIDGGDGNAVLASGQTRLVLRSVPEVAPVNRRLMHLNLEVDGLLRVHDELKSKGVRFTYAPRAVNRGALLELWAAAFRDPDGHGIAIIEWRDREQPVASPASTT
ncbi:VOC family protein [Micromonospora sp. LOL_023]|uniref:VOC family protein n=1 Tax=Micromonospora sp. LOL_023 TaxID=3345418 RepID=UPI003A84A15D